MTKTPRFIAPLIKEAAKTKTKLPWERGLRRTAFIARRTQGTSNTLLRASA